MNGNATQHVLPVVLHTRVVNGAGGGPEKTILNSPRFLPKLGYSGICGYMRGNHDAPFDAIRQKANTLGARLVEISDSGPFDFAILGRCLKICRENNVAIWHGHDYKSNAIGLALKKRHPMRLVTTVHGWGHHERRTRLYYAIDRFCIKRYDKVICVSEDLYKRCVDGGVDHDRCELIENAIDPSAFKRVQEASDAKRQFNIPPGAQLVGAVGRLSAEKGFDCLIRAFSKISSSRPNLFLYIAGEGELRPELEALIQQLGVSNRVRLIGLISDVVPFFTAMDVFVLSSIREGLPNVILEAMALEVPLIATRIAGIPRIVTHDENGLIVEPTDQKALEHELIRVLDDRTLQLRLAKNARRTIETSYTFQNRMEKICRIYDDLTETRLDT